MTHTQPSYRPSCHSVVEERDVIGSVSELLVHIILIHISPSLATCMLSSMTAVIYQNPLIKII